MRNGLRNADIKIFILKLQKNLEFRNRFTNFINYYD